MRRRRRLIRHKLAEQCVLVARRRRLGCGGAVQDDELIKEVIGIAWPRRDPEVPAVFVGGSSIHKQLLLLEADGCQSSILRRRAHCLLFSRTLSLRGRTPHRLASVFPSRFSCFLSVTLRRNGLMAGSA